MGLMGIFDFMLVNGRIAWNMSCTDESCANRRFELSNADYRCIVAHELLQYRDVRNIDLIAESSLLRNAMGRPLLSDHQPSNTEKGTRVCCCVCRIEDGIHNLLKKHQKEGSNWKMYWVLRQLSICRKVFISESGLLYVRWISALLMHIAFL